MRFAKMNRLGRPRGWGGKDRGRPGVAEHNSHRRYEIEATAASAMTHSPDGSRFEAKPTGFGATPSMVARDEAECDPGGVLSRVRAELNLT